MKTPSNQFAAPKSTDRVYSVARDRVRCLEQTRYGPAAARARIHTKYRTRLTRIKQRLQREVQTGHLTEVQMEQQLKEEHSKFEVQKAQEIETTEAAWKNIRSEHGMDVMDENSQEYDEEIDDGDDDNNSDNDDDEDQDGDNDDDDDDDDDEETTTMP